MRQKLETKQNYADQHAVIVILLFDYESHSIPNQEEKIETLCEIRSLYATVFSFVRSSMFTFFCRGRFIMNYEACMNEKESSPLCA